MASLHDIGKLTVLKMPRKEGLSLSEIGDLKVDKTHDHDFETRGHDFWISKLWSPVTKWQK